MQLSMLLESESQHFAEVLVIVQGQVSRHSGGSEHLVCSQVVVKVSHRSKELVLGTLQWAASKPEVMVARG